MQSSPKTWAAVTAALLLTHAAAFYAGYQYKASEFTPVVEGPRSGAALPGGGVLLPRVPGGEAAIDQPKPPTKGAAHIRGSEITIGGVKPQRRPEAAGLPTRNEAHAEGKPAQGSKPECLTADDFVCPSVKVRFDLWEHDDNTWGVTAVTDKGEVVGGMDLPDRQPFRFTPKVWAAGAEYEVGSGDVALVLQRDLGPFRVGGAVEVKSEDPEVRLQGVLRF